METRIGLIRKLFAFLLAACVLFCMQPIAAFAADETGGLEQAGAAAMTLDGADAGEKAPATPSAYSGDKDLPVPPVGTGEEDPAIPTVGTGEENPAVPPVGTGEEKPAAQATDPAKNPETVNDEISAGDEFEAEPAGEIAAFDALEEDAVCQIVDAGGAIVESYEDLAAALLAVTDGQTIRLLENIDYSAGIVIKGMTVTFDVNGYVLNVKNAAGHALEVSAGGTMLLDNTKGGEFNAASTGTNRHGVYVTGGGKATVTKATGTGGGTDTRAAYATGAGSSITVLKNASGGFYGLGAYGGAAITVHGNVSGGGGMTVGGAGTTVTVYGYSSGGGTGIFATDSATVYVRGNVIGGGSGVYAGTGAQVTIDGTVTASSGGYVYITINTTVNKYQGDHETVSQKPGYFEYKDGATNVWVKDPGLVGGPYTVTVNDSYAASNGAGKYTPGATVTINAGEREGYIFNGWIVDDVDLALAEVSGAVTSFTMPAKNETFTAAWVLAPVQNHLVSFVDWDGKIFKTEYVKKGGKATAPPSPKRSGYKFSGWDKTYTNVQEDITVTAQYVKTYTPKPPVTQTTTGDHVTTFGSPKTGDSFNPLFPILGLGIALNALVVLIIFDIRRKKSSKSL